MEDNDTIDVYQEQVSHAQENNGTSSTMVFLSLFDRLAVRFKQANLS